MLEVCDLKCARVLIDRIPIAQVREYEYVLKLFGSTKRWKILVLKRKSMGLPLVMRVTE